MKSNLNILPSSADFISAAREVRNWSSRSLPAVAPKLNLGLTLRQKVSCIQQAMLTFSGCETGTSNADDNIASARSLHTPSNKSIIRSKVKAKRVCNLEPRRGVTDCAHQMNRRGEIYVLLNLETGAGKAAKGDRG